MRKIKIARENPWSWKVLSIESDKKRPWWKSDKRRRQEIKSPTKSLTAVVKKYTLIIKMRPIKSESVIFQKPSKILKMRAWSFKTHPSPSFWKFRRYHKSSIVIKKHNNDLGLKNHPTPKHQKPHFHPQHDAIYFWDQGLGFFAYFYQKAHKPSLKDSYQRD